MFQCATYFATSRMLAAAVLGQRATSIWGGPLVGLGLFAPFALLLCNLLVASLPCYWYSACRFCFVYRGAGSLNAKATS